MNFHILGPLEVLHDGGTVELGSSKQRGVLALLVLHANEPLSTDRLIDELWAENPPATAAKTLHVYISRLRRSLGAENGRGGELIVTRGHCYELTVDPRSVDAQWFELLIDQGKSELALGNPEQAATLLERALGLWRGRPLADMAYEPFAQRAIARLDALRVAAVEALIDAKLALARHQEVLPALEALTADYPYREHLHAQLMLALYRSERQADALQAYQDARNKLVGELGIEPGAGLREMERAILAQDPALAVAHREPATVGQLAAADLHDRVADVEERLAGLHDRLGEVDEATDARSDAGVERRAAARDRAVAETRPPGAG